MIVYRLTSAAYASDLSGKGAAIAGGRWNSKGTEILYTSESAALSMLELSAHISPGLSGTDFHLIHIEIPDILLKEMFILTPSLLPPGWRQYPYSKNVQKTGDQFIAENKFLILKVPSVFVPDSFNYLINPDHKSFKKISIVSQRKADIDPRIVHS